MEVQLVHDHDDRRGVGVVDVDRLRDAMRLVAPGPPVAGRRIPPAAERLGHEEDVGYPAADVLRVVARRAAGGRWQRPPGVGQEPTAGLVEADHRARRVVGPLVDGEHVMNPLDS